MPLPIKDWDSFRDLAESCNRVFYRLEEVEEGRRVKILASDKYLYECIAKDEADKHYLDVLQWCSWHAVLVGQYIPLERVFT
jgi:hypothetical protein